MEGDLIKLVDGLLDAIAAKGSCELIEDFAASIPIEVIGNLLDVPHDERAPLRDWSLAILGALVLHVGGTYTRICDRNIRKFGSPAPIHCPPSGRAIAYEIQGAATLALRSLSRLLAGEGAE